jgi:hypothetical protein
MLIHSVSNTSASGRSGPGPSGQRPNQPGPPRSFLPPGGLLLGITASPVISQDLVRAASPERVEEELRTYVVKSTFEAQGRAFKFSWEAQSGNPLSVAAGQEGFVLGGIYIDTDGHQWRKFALARSSLKGWVQNNNLQVGKIHGQCTLIDKTSVPLRSSENLGTHGTVLERALEMIHSEMLASRRIFLKS